MNKVVQLKDSSGNNVYPTFNLASLGDRSIPQNKASMPQREGWSGNWHYFIFPGPSKFGVLDYENTHQMSRLSGDICYTDIYYPNIFNNIWTFQYQGYVGGMISSLCNNYDFYLNERRIRVYSNATTTTYVKIAIFGQMSI